MVCGQLARGTMIERKGLREAKAILYGAERAACSGILPALCQQFECE